MKLKSHLVMLYDLKEDEEAKKDRGGRHQCFV
jgi:hypothetical protein